MLNFDENSVYMKFVNVCFVQIYLYSGSVDDEITMCQEIP